jgi:hypothetical protein
MNYNALTLFPHELLTMTLNPIKLPSYDTFHTSSVKWVKINDQQSYVILKFFPFIFSLISDQYNDVYTIQNHNQTHEKWRQKWKKKN